MARHLQRVCFEFFNHVFLGGSGVAANHVGHCYEYGKGVSMDLEKAFTWYEKAAKKNNIHGLENLGMF